MARSILTIFAALANAASTAARLPSSQSRAMLLGATSKRTGAPGLTARTGSITAGSGSYSQTVHPAGGLARAPGAPAQKAARAAAGRERGAGGWGPAAVN